MTIFFTPRPPYALSVSAAELSGLFRECEEM